MSLAWRISWMRRSARRRICRRLYRDAAGDPARAMIVAGTARSGTTWVGEIVRAQLPCRVMFEPFHNRLVPEYADRPYFLYKRPGDDDPELESFTRSVLSGELRNRWIDREVDLVRPRWRLVKEIRVNLMLAWIAKQFPDTPIALLVRHPCAVVLSRMQLGWATRDDLEPMLAQPALVAEHLDPHVEFLRGLETPEELHAAVWSISNLVPLAQRHGEGNARFDLFHYEHLCDAPEREVPRLMAALGKPFDASRAAAVTRPSQTSRHTSAVVRGGDRVAAWTRKLDSGQVRRILAVTERLGLAGLYGDAPRPFAPIP